MTIYNERGSLIIDLCSFETHLEHPSHQIASNGCANSDYILYSSQLKLYTFNPWRVILFMH